MATLGDQLRSNFMNMTPEEIRRDQLIRIRRENPWPDVDPQIRRPAPPPNIGPDPYDFPEQRVSFPESDAGPVGDTGPEGVAGSAGNDDLDMTSYNELLSNARAGRGLRDTTLPTSPGTPSSYRPAMASRTPDSTADFSVRRSEPQLPEYSYGGQPKELPEVESAPSTRADVEVEPGPMPSRSLRPGMSHVPGVRRVSEPSGWTDAGVGSRYAGMPVHEEAMKRADPRNYDADDETPIGSRIVEDEKARVGRGSTEYWSGINIPGVGKIAPPRHFKNSGYTTYAGREAAMSSSDLDKEAERLRVLGMARTTTPTAPEKGFVGNGAKAKFYAGRGEQPETLGGELQGVAAGRDSRRMIPRDDYQPKTREGALAMRAEEMRGSEEYKRAVAGARAANMDGMWYNAKGGPRALEIGQTTPIGPPVPEYVDPRSPEQLAEAKAQRIIRKEENDRRWRNVSNRATGTPYEPGLSGREQIALQMQNRGLDTAVQLKKMDNDSADKRINEARTLADRAEMLKAEAEHSAAKDLYTREPSPINKQRVEEAERKARQMTAIYLAGRQGGAGQVPGAQPASPGAPPTAPTQTGPPSAARSVATVNSALQKGKDIAATSGTQAGARAYVDALGSTDLTPEEMDYGMIFTREHLQGAIEAAKRDKGGDMYDKFGSFLVGYGRPDSVMNGVPAQYISGMPAAAYAAWRAANGLPPDERPVTRNLPDPRSTRDDGSPPDVRAIEERRRLGLGPNDPLPRTIPNEEFRRRPSPMLPGPPYTPSR